MSEQTTESANPDSKVPTNCDSPDRIRAGEGPFQPLARVYTDVPFPQLVLEARQVRENYGGTFKVCQSVLPYVDMPQPTSSSKPETSVPLGASAPAESVGDTARNVSQNAANGAAKAGMAAAKAAAETTGDKAPPKKK